MLIYPENWEEPTPPAPIVLTSAQRAALKTKMQTYINNKGVPILLRELCQTAHDYVLENTGKHINDDVFKEVAMEIQAEWHPPAEPEE